MTAKAQEELKKSTKNYLDRNISIVGFDGKSFCSYEVLGFKESGEIVNEYLWVLCQEFYKENSNLKRGSGVSLPVALSIERQESNYKIVRHRIPRDGNLNSRDVEEIFPKSIHDKIFPGDMNYYNKRVRTFEAETEEEAKAYFNQK